MLDRPWRAMWHVGARCCAPAGPPEDGRAAARPYGRAYLRRLALFPFLFPLFRIFMAGFFFADAAASRRRARTQPGFTDWRARAMPSASGGTLSVMVEPAAT